VMGSLKQVSQGLQEKGWPASVSHDPELCRAWLEVTRPEELDFLYEIRLRDYARPSFAYPEMDRSPEGDVHYYRAEVFLRRGGQSYDVFGYDEHELIGDVLDQFEKYLHFRHISPGTLPWNMAEHDELLQTAPQETPPAGTQG